MDEAPWKINLYDHTPRSIPHEIKQRLLASNAVEDLSDGLLNRGINSTFNFNQPDAKNDNTTFVGSIITARYIPRRTQGNDLRPGHAKIVEHITPGSLVIIDATQCSGSVCGSKAAQMLQAGGASAVFIDGTARDRAEMAEDGIRVWAAHWGVRTGCHTSELYEVGGTITFFGVSVWPDDIVVANRYGGVFVPAWVSWEIVDTILSTASE